MSAYALPGSLFPPIYGSRGDQPVNGCSSIPVSNSKPPLHYFYDTSSHSSTLGRPTNAKPCGDAAAEDGRNGHGASEVGIAVKQAKIDPVRLIQLLTGRRGMNRPPMDAPRTRSGHGESGSIPLEIQTQDERVPQTCTKSSNLHGDAIQFELSISFNGRSYTATRTLPRIIELRNDLIRELNTRRRMLRNRRMRWRNQPKTVDGQDSDEDTVATIDDEDLDVTIPELPDCDSEAGAIHGGGIASRGFTMLQALLRPYCPAMERWLRNVADLMPPNSSPSLTNFLWEPVSIDSPGERLGGMRSCSSLDCIQEGDDMEEEEDASDCDGNHHGRLS